MVYHIYPVEDLKDHTIDGTTCECAPVIKQEESGDLLVIHNSYDGREGLELANEILNK